MFLNEVHLKIFKFNCVSVCVSFPSGTVVKNLPASVGDAKRHGFNPWIGKIPWRRKLPSAPVFLPGESQGQRNLAGYSPWVCKESDMTEQLSTYTQCVCVYIYICMYIYIYET